MRTIGRWLGCILLTLIIMGGLAWLLGPREPVGDVTFQAAVIGEDVDAYLAQIETGVPNLKPGQQKAVIWAGEPGATTEYALVYIHGFSSSLQEIRPVPDLVAQDIGANLVYTRLKGHGQDSAAMAHATVEDWLNDTAEALAIGRKIGDKVLVVSTSTGGTLVAAALHDPQLAQGVLGSVFISPNFKVTNPAAALLTWPFARWWVPLVGGKTRSWNPANAQQAEYWTTSYPTVATLPMAAIVEHVAGLDYATLTIPALFLFSDQDTVVSHDATRQMAENWGGPVVLSTVNLPAGSDPSNHVIAGDILSPEMTQPVRQMITDWFQTIPK